MIEAAGGAVWRHASDGGLRVLLVHRPRYDDWTLPKGKLEPREDAPDAACREVLEETGLRCELGPELPTVSYRDHRGRPKRVRYWAMHAPDGEFRPNDEADVARWVPVAEAAEVLSYEHDVVVVTALADADIGPG